MNREYLKFIGKNSIINFVTYTIMGLLAANLLGYKEIWQETLTRVGYRDFDSIYVMIGPLLQPIRGAVYGIILWPIRELIINKKSGWLVLFGLLWGIGIFGTFAAPIGSFEGLIYTSHPLKMHLFGQPEITGHALLYSLFLYKWCNKESLNFKRVIKAIIITITGKACYIVQSLIITTLLSQNSSGEVNPMIYLVLLLSTLFLLTAVLLGVLDKIRGKKLYLLVLISLLLPYVLYNIVVGTSIQGLIINIFTATTTSFLTYILIKKGRV